MINLLPTDYRTHLRYGRLNARLSRWLVIGVACIAGLILVLASGWLYMDQQIKNLNRSVTDIEQQLKDQDLTGVQKQADEISQNVRVIDQVLSREIRFSELIQEIGKVMPPGTVLNSLTLSEKVSGALNFNANAKSHASAAQIAVNLSDPKNNIFAKVDIVNVNCSSLDTEYPCTGSYRALFDKEAARRFLNVAGESQ